MSDYGEIFNEYGFNEVGFDTSFFENMDFSFLGIAFGVVLVIILIILLFSLILKLLEIIGFWKIFKKDDKPGRASLIPFYNTYVKTEVGGIAWRWMLLVYISRIVALLGVAVTGGLSYVLSIVTIFSKFNINYNICKKYGKDVGFAILLTLVPFVGALVLGGKNYKYDKNVVTSEFGIFKSN